MATEGIECEGEQMLREDLLVLVREGLVARFEAAGDEEVAYGSLTVSLHRSGRREGRKDEPNLLWLNSRTCFPTASKRCCFLSSVVLLTLC